MSKPINAVEADQPAHMLLTASDISRFLLVSVAE